MTTPPEGEEAVATETTEPPYPIGYELAGPVGEAIDAQRWADAARRRIARAAQFNVDT